jgi:NitT/TauT family transport system substrate-binding protein
MNRSHQGLDQPSTQFPGSREDEMDDARIHQSRRRAFLARASLLGAAALAGFPRPALAEPPPEVTRIRLVRVPALCFAPQYVAEELLRLEGFTEVEYVKLLEAIPSTLEKSADLAMFGGPSILPAIDAGFPIVSIAGVHEGCWELFAHDPVRTIQDLRGRSVAIGLMGGTEHVWLSSMLAYVGIDPRTEIDWVTETDLRSPKRLFMEGKASAFLGFPPEPQELRALKVGRVIVNTTLDRPWSQYFCCMIAGHRDFVTKNPVATKRALRAMLKAADICSRDPERAARLLVEKGYEPRYEIALEVLKGLSYDRWRTDNPADTLRFHALRLRDAGMIKSTPQQIIDRGSDFRFLNELKKELKA